MGQPLPRTAVIGAGISGLTAGKMLPHYSDIKAYLDAYADAFGLLDNIEFGNGVVHAGRRDGGGWNIEDQAGNHREFDLLIVANGHHWDPRLPDFPGTFTGEAIHSHHYIDPLTPLKLTGKRILVVGIGNSAADITVELSSKTLQNNVTISTRSSAWIVPKYIAGRPGDTFFRTSPYIPLSWRRKAIQMLAPVMGINPQLYGLPASNHKPSPAHQDLAFIGFAQSVPTLFPFVEYRSRLLAAYAVGRYALPPVAEMERVIEADQIKHTGHRTNRPRHTQQVDDFIYKHDLRTREIPAGRKRAAQRPRPPRLASV